MSDVEICSFYFSNWFTDMLTETCIPSLFLESNIPKLMKNRKVSHNIYCTLNETDYIKEKYIPLANQLGLAVSIYDRILPHLGDHYQKRTCLYMALQDQIRKSIHNKSVIVVAPSDMVFGNGLSDVIDNLEYGEYLVCGQPRISYENGYEKIKKFLKTNPTSNLDFAKICIEEIPHTILQEAKKQKHEYLSLQKASDGWIAYFKEPPPLVFYGTEEILQSFDLDNWCGRFEMIDHELPNIFFKKNKLKWIDDSNVFMWAEFTSNNNYKSMIHNNWKCEATDFFKNLPLRWRTKNSITIL